MGRKAAPQPLTLSDPSAALGHDDLSNAETNSQGVSPAESRSPKSSRSSPFHSRFSPLKSQDRKQQKQTPTQVHTQPQTQTDTQILAQQQRQQKSQQSMQLQLRQEPNHHAQPNYQTSTHDVPSTYPPISSAFDQPPTPPAKNGTTPGKGQHEAKKASRNGFFHFNKASKASNHYQPHVNQSKHNNHHDHSEVRSQMMSRGSDSASRSRYGGKFLCELCTVLILPSPPAGHGKCNRLWPSSLGLELPPQPGILRHSFRTLTSSSSNQTPRNPISHFANHHLPTPRGATSRYHPHPITTPPRLNPSGRPSRSPLPSSPARDRCAKKAQARERIWRLPSQPVTSPSFISIPFH